MVFADMHHRMAAFVIDWHIRTIPIALWGLWLFSMWFPEFHAAAAHRHDAILPLAWELLAPKLGQPAIAWSAVAALVAYFIYHPVVELVMHGDSPGKRMTGISVRTLQGETPAVPAILLRNAWRAIEFLPFGYLSGLLFMLRSPQHARPGDRAAGTRVVMATRRRDA